MVPHIESHNDIDQPTRYYDYFADIFTFDILLHSRAFQGDRFRVIFTNINGDQNPVADSAIDLQDQGDLLHLSLIHI